MQASLLDDLGVGPLVPHRWSNPVMIRCPYAGSCSGFQVTNRAIPAHQLQPVIDEVFRLAEANESYRYFAD